MKQLVALLLFLSASSFGQVPVISQVASSQAGSSLSTNIQDVTITVRPDQYKGQNITVTASAIGQLVTTWSWQIINPITRYVVRTASGSSPPVFTLDTLGFYDIKITTSNIFDFYTQYLRRPFEVFKPRVLEGSADLIVDVSTGTNCFKNFSGQDWSDKVIFIKGTSSNRQIEFLNLRGTNGHPVTIQKAADNTIVDFSFDGGNGRPFWLSGYVDNTTGSQGGCQYVTLNGFNLDGSRGIKITGGSNTNTVISGQGKHTDINISGVEVVHSLAVHGPAVTFVPTVSSQCNIGNWRAKNMTFYRLKVTNAGDEGIYVGESSQDPGYIGNNGFTPPIGPGFLVAWCVVEASGRDGIQPGSQLGEVHDNIVMNWGKWKNASHESCICHNPGSAVVYTGNTCIGGKMGINIISGLFPFDSLDTSVSKHSPLPTIFIGNEFSNGTYDHVGGGAEPFFVYGQNNPSSGPGIWNILWANNVFNTDLKMAEVLIALGGFHPDNIGMINNVIIKTGNAGDYPELNFTGDGQGTVTGTTVNNIVREGGSDISDLSFSNVSTYNYNITSFSSAIYGGSPTNLLTKYPAIAKYYYDKLGFPLSVTGSGYQFGSHSGYNKRLIP